MGNNCIKPVTETDNWCTTVVGETVKSRFNWTIEGFKRREEKTGESIQSNTFKICDPEGKLTSWCLKLYPRGENTNNQNHVALYLFLCDDDDSKMKIDFELFLLDVKSKRKKVLTVKSREFSKEPRKNLL